MSTTTSTYLNIGPYQEIISGISTVFSFSDGVVKLSGPVGAGKTSLLNELIKELRAENFEVVDFKTPPKSVDELQSTLIRKFKLGADISFRKSLIRYLSTKPRDLQKLILVIDDANLMSVEALAGVHALRDMENNGQVLLSLLVCGDKTLNAHLAQPELAALQADISLNYSLNPLEDEELSLLCTAYLQQAGKGRIQLDSTYLDALKERTRGLPGEILGELQAGLSDPGFLLTHTKSELPPEEERREPTALGQAIHNISEQIQNIPPDTKRWLKPTASVLFAAAAASTVYVYYPKALVLYDEFRNPSTAQPAPIAVNQAPAPAPAQPAPQPVEPQSTPVAAQQPQVAQTAPAQAPVIASTQPAATPAMQPTAPAVTPARPSTPAPAVVATITTPAAAIQPASAADLEVVVNRWIAAWQQQDTNAYLGFYHTDFASLYHDNRSSWRDDRARSITRPTHIELELSDLEVAGTDATGTTVRFRLNYQSPTYADRTLKELVLGRDLDGQLRILRELNLDVEVQPDGRLANVTSGSTTQPKPATANAATATRIGPPMVIQPNASVAALPNTRDNINQFISSWLNSWQHKDLNGYFNHYDPQFKAQSMTSTDAWRDDRTVKIVRPAVIQLQLENMELVNENSEGAVVHLTLAYHSTYYADRTEKEIKLQRTSDGILHIIEEKNIAVETLPLSRLLPSNTLAMLELAQSIAQNQL